MSSMPYVFIWLDQRIGTLPGGNQTIKDHFRKLLNPIKHFDKPNVCFDYLKDSTKDKQILFFTTNVFAEEDFLRSISHLKNVLFIYIYDQFNHQYRFTDPILNDKCSDKRICSFDEQLLQQLIFDLIELNQNQSQLLIKQSQSKQAKQILEYSLQLTDLIQDNQINLQDIQSQLQNKINQIK